MTSSDRRDPSGAFYFSRWTAALPLALMLAPVVALSFSGVVSSQILLLTGAGGLMIGSLFSRRKAEYWDVVVKALTDPMGLLVFAILLLVGIYGALLEAADLSEAIVWLAQQIEAGPAAFTVLVYVVCAVLGSAMGTSLGIVVVMTPILYPAAVAVGVHPALAAGAILSGAATGDHFAPVSDTTIISSSTQLYRTRSGSADVGGVVRARMLYVIPAFVLSCILYLIAGSMRSSNVAQESSPGAVASSPDGLLMLLPMAVVVAVAMSRRTIFEALTYGILACIALGLAGGLFELRELFLVEGGAAGGILIEGAVANVETISMIVLLMGAYGVLRAYGLLDAAVASMTRSFAKSPRAAELTIFGFVWLLSFALIGLVARLTVIAGPVVNALGRTQNLHPYRRANILDAVANSFSYIVPWHVWPVLMLLQIRPLTEQSPDLALPQASAFLYSTFYPVVIWCVMLAAIVTGVGRRFEETDGGPPS